MYAELYDHEVNEIIRDQVHSAAYDMNENMMKIKVKQLRKLIKESIGPVDWPMKLTVQTKAFKDQPMQHYTIKVDRDGFVRVFDPMTKNYTAKHDLSPATLKRIEKLVDSKMGSEIKNTLDDERFYRQNT